LPFFFTGLVSNVTQGSRKAAPIFDTFNVEVIFLESASVTGLFSTKI
jgi:hypothetical protein